MRLKEIDGLITAIATVLLAIITALLGGIAYWQYQELHSTDQTLRDTLKANVAAERAFIYMQPTGITMSVEGDGHRYWVVRVQIGNSGTTSTSQMRYQLGCTTNPEKIFDPSMITAHIARHVIGSKVVDGSLEGCIKTDQEMNDLIEDSAAKLYVFGTTTYKDIFQAENGAEVDQFVAGKNHTTNFCVEMSKFGRRDDPVQKMPVIYAHAAHCVTPKGQNCIDDQCKDK